MTSGFATADEERSAPTPAAPEEPGTGRAKSIILFSDGTGNSSATLFKTNVWRMYEAIDLGPASGGKRDQVSYYDDGVGTSSFKPLRVLGGAFGWGLKRNVLDIYRYACRNYRDGDDIYAFGFSRGAFTVRVAIALIASQGLVRSTSEAELDRKSLEAFRAYRAAHLPRRLQWPTKLYRRVRGLVTRRIARLRGRAPYDPDGNCRPTIRFVGVWDTVAAYGGPITEVTRAIDNWLYALSMPNYQLNERVLCARHALAIDDERDAFHPLLWDEVHEQRLIDEGRVPPGRLEQVWFTGMHSDVGGGYPDESLSYVSLLWMMEEAEKAGLRTLTVVKDRFVALASSYGPIHDSRAGLGAYYRYQPRKIAAWLDPCDPQTRSLRDPAITDPKGRPRGLLRSVSVHESVINRITTGTDRYAPITLPSSLRIVPPQAEGENAPQADNQTPAPPERRAPTPMVSRGIRARLTDPAGAEARAAATESIWDFVWWRRLTYFATLAATLLLVALPFGVGRLPEPPILADGRTWIGGIIGLLTIVLPDFAGGWVNAYAENPFYFLLLGGIILLCLKLAGRLERRLRDEARRVWREAAAGDPGAAPPPSRIQRFRNSPRYQRAIQLIKWYVLPDWVVAPVLVLALAWLGVAVFAQMALPLLENGTLLCQPPAGSTGPLTLSTRDFRTRDVCSAGFGRVEENQRYVVTFDVVDAWFDSQLATSPEGLAAGDLPWGLGYLAAPLRRVPNARFMQPVVEIRPANGGRAWGPVRIDPITVRPVGDSAALYRAEFTARRSGELFLFVNDAMVPVQSRVWGRYNYRYFYEASGTGPGHERGNRGTACVTVERAGATERPAGTPPAGPICERAAARGEPQRTPTRQRRDPTPGSFVSDTGERRGTFGAGAARVVG